MTGVPVGFPEPAGAFTEGWKGLLCTQYCALGEASVGEELPPVNPMTEGIMWSQYYVSCRVPWHRVRSSSKEIINLAPNSASWALCQF